MRDSYERFFAEGYITKEQFFEFGLKETIYAPIEEAEQTWEELKNRIYSNEEAYIRGFGRNSNGSYLFQELYRLLHNNENIQIDQTNNDRPVKLISALTGYSKTGKSNHEPIRNYQISHVFGRTKNVFAFTAPWNIVFTPKIVDPFTGHEAKGEMVEEYTALFKSQTYSMFKAMIDDFNAIMADEVFKERIANSLDIMTECGKYSSKEMHKLKTALVTEFSPIVV